MRLYSRTGATAVTDPETGTPIEPDENGAFDFPEQLGALLVTVHHRGKKLWETDIERQHRLVAEEMARRSDPQTLLGAVESLVRLAERSGAAKAAEAETEPAKPARGRGKAAETPPPADGDPNT